MESIQANAGYIEGCTEVGYGTAEKVFAPVWQAIKSFKINLKKVWNSSFGIKCQRHVNMSWFKFLIFPKTFVFI